MYIQQFGQRITLEPYHIEGFLRYAGLKASKAEEIYSSFRQDIESTDTLPYEEIIRQISSMIEDRSSKRKFIRIHDYLKAAWNRNIEQPIFIFIGGSSGTGKDTLCNILREQIDIDRMYSTDTMRDILRNEIESKYQHNAMPSNLSVLFQPTYEVGVDGFKAQCALLDTQIKAFIYRSIQEVVEHMHPLYIIEGVHLLPNYYDNIKSYIQIFLNPPEQTLRDRVLHRWAKESSSINKEQKQSRIANLERLLDIQRYIIMQARNHGRDIHILNTVDREETLNAFVDLLTLKIEETLDQGSRTDLD